MCNDNVRCRKSYECGLLCAPKCAAQAAPVDPLRGTGRTSRTIERAICGMLMGKAVLLVMAKQCDVKLAVDYAAEWLRRNGFTDNGIAPLTIEKTNGVLRFGTGLMRIKPMAANLCGLRADLTLQDHHVLYLQEQERLKQERIADQATILRLLDKHGYRSVIGSKMQSGPKFIRHDGGKE